MIRQIPLAFPKGIYSVAISDDGKRIAAGGVAWMAPAKSRCLYVRMKTALPPKIKAIQEKVAGSRSSAEAAELDKYHKDGVGQIANVKVGRRGDLRSCIFSPGGKALAAAGSDGKVRLINPENGSVLKEFAPRPGQASGGGA